MIISAVVVIWGFNRILLINSVTFLLSGCIWFPQIIYNARNGIRNTQKMRHIIIVQVTISWLTIYVRVNATGVFNLQPQDTFAFFYGLMVCF
jgi:hypothetical protein